MGVLRDPLILERPAPTGRRVQWSKNPEAEALAVARRAELDAREEARRQRPSPRRAAAAVATASKRTELPAYSPSECPNDCRGLRSNQPWSIPAGTELGPDDHHPVCMHAAKWAQARKPTAERRVLYDLETSTVMRDALGEEVAQAEEARSKTGVAQVQLQGRMFAVLSLEDAQAASREARGEEPGAASEGSAETGETAEALLSGERSESTALPAGSREFPMLSEITAATSGSRLQKRDRVTAGDYLARPLSSAGAGQ